MYPEKTATSEFAPESNNPSLGFSKADFSKPLSIFPQFQNQHFARIKRLGVPSKEEKCYFFFSNRKSFLHAFLPAIAIFQSPFRFFCSSKNQHFARIKRIMVPSKEEKCHFFFSNRKSFLHAFLRAILIFQSPFQFFRSSKTSILQG